MSLNLFLPLLTFFLSKEKKNTELETNKIFRKSLVLFLGSSGSSSGRCNIQQTRPCLQLFVHYRCFHAESRPSFCFSHPKLVFFTFSRERKNFDLEGFLHRCEIFTGLESPIPFWGVAKKSPPPRFCKRCFWERWLGKDWTQAAGKIATICLCPDGLVGGQSVNMSGTHQSVFSITL